MPAPRRYVALLRGINVGGKHKVAMTDLRDVFDSLGHRDVATYIQSGNVAFTSSAEIRRIVAGIERALSARFGFAIPVLVRSHSELADVAAHNPYLVKGADTSQLHVIFLSSVPPSARVSGLDPDRSPPDRFTVRGSEIYCQYPNGSGRTKLTIGYFERQLATRATARNWNTVNKLVALSD